MPVACASVRIFVGLPFPGTLGPSSDEHLFECGTGRSTSLGRQTFGTGSVRRSLLPMPASRPARPDRLGVRLSLSGQVAKAWIAAIEAHGQIESARALVEHLETVEEWTQERYLQGSLSLVDVRVAKSDIERARAVVRERTRARDLFVRQVEMLACEYPAGERVPTAELPPLPPQVPAGLPSELVQRRPDLIAAEQGTARRGRPDYRG